MVFVKLYCPQQASPEFQYLQSKAGGPLVGLPVLISLIEVSSPMGKPLFLILYTQIKTPFRGTVGPSYN